jgi:hypothetical protein
MNSRATSGFEYKSSSLMGLLQVQTCVHDIGQDKVDKDSRQYALTLEAQTLLILQGKLFRTFLHLVTAKTLTRRRRRSPW